MECEVVESNPPPDPDHDPRLGVLGFLASEDLRSRSLDGGTGNYGIQETLLLQRGRGGWVALAVAFRKLVAVG